MEDKQNTNTPGLRFKVGDRVRDQYGVLGVIERIDIDDPTVPYRVSKEKYGLVWHLESELSPADHPPSPSILTEAESIVSGRDSTYGTPERNLERIAARWSTVRAAGDQPGSVPAIVQGVGQEMTFDKSKLTPGPWESLHCVYTSANSLPFGPWTAEFRFNGEAGPVATPDDFRFISIARQAFEVMMKRQWFPRFIGSSNGKQQWVAYSWSNGCSLRDSTAAVMSRQPGTLVFDDPFTCLVEADKWWRECVENQP